MANSFYQTTTIPRLYVSYPLWQYANGALDQYAIDEGLISDEELIQLIQLDPSKTITIPQSENGAVQLNYRINPKSDESDMRYNKLWDFNYVMILGHNFATANASYFCKAEGTGSYLATDNLINFPAVQNPLTYDGFSISTGDDGSVIVTAPALVFTKILSPAKAV